MELNKILRESAFILSLRSNELQMQCEGGFRFVIPVKDLNGAEVHYLDKAIRYMKWIKPQFESTQVERVKG